MTEFVFVHAIGRPGRDAWPVQAAHPTARFLTRRGFVEEQLPSEFAIDDEGHWIADHTERSSIVVGHSWSAVAVLASVLAGGSPARAAVLIEPPATFVAPDEPVVRQHVADLAPAFVAGLSLEDFRARFSAGMGFELPLPDSQAAVRSLELLRRHRPPWETSLTPGDLPSLRIPVAVITGGWNPLYEVIADALSDFPLVSRHTIPGGGHRPQDTQQFNEFLTTWSDPGS
ncbi:MAG TPA: alpha/beta hydrolase [Microthrixaceae bacterium]|nr:alpha/beta hydrolase [Microthrixaceae bacterium]